MVARKPTLTYKYRGQIERGNGRPGYDWKPGFSLDSDDGNPMYPWMTKRECQHDAKTKGARAVFIGW